MLNIIGAIILFINSLFAPSTSLSTPTLDPKYGIQLHLPENYYFVSAIPRKGETGEVIDVQIKSPSGNDIYFDIVSFDYTHMYSQYQDYASCDSINKHQPVSSSCITKKYKYLEAAHTAVYKTDECSPGSSMWSMAINPKSNYRYVAFHMLFRDFDTKTLAKYDEFCVNETQGIAATKEYKAALPQLVQGKNLSEYETKEYEETNTILNSIQFVK